MLIAIRTSDRSIRSLIPTGTRMNTLRRGQANVNARRLLKEGPFTIPKMMTSLALDRVQITAWKAYLRVPPAFMTLLVLHLLKVDSAKAYEVV